MELFDKIYNCYYNAIRHILDSSSKKKISKKEMEDICRSYGFKESHLIIVPKLTNGTWPLLEKKDGTSYESRLICKPGVPPLTRLQKAWVRSILSDKRFNLFFNEDEIEELELYFSEVKPLYCDSDFYYFDQYRDGDPYESAQYRLHFQTVLEAMRKRLTLLIAYKGKHGILTYDAAPYQLQYSSKDDKFRLCCLEYHHGQYNRNTILNMARIKSCQISTQKAPENLDACCFRPIQRAPEPVQLEISGERNSLERCMLHFASYEKHTQYDEDRKCWLCSIYYDLADETELLIDILSFGPVVQVTGPDSFVSQIQKRVRRQHNLFYGVINNKTDS